MGFQQMSFQPETFAQANPVLSGIEASQAIQANRYNNQIAAAKAQYAQPMGAQGLRAAILNNQVLNASAQNAMPQANANTQILQNTARFAPLMSQSTLDTQASSRGLMGAQAGLAGAQAQGIYQGQIPYQQAQAAMTQAQIPYVPEISMGKYYQGLGRVMQYSPTAMLMRAQNNPMMQSIVANNPHLAANLTGVNTALLNGQNPSLNAMGINVFGQGGIGSQLPPPQKQVQQVLQNQPQQQGLGAQGIPYALPSQVQNMAQQMGGYPSPQQNINSQNVSGVNTPFGPVNPLDAANLQSQAQNALVSKNYTPQQAQQMVYDNSAQNMLTQLTPDMQSLSTFSGIGGMASLKDQQVRASMNLPTSPNYQKYINFSRVQAPLLVNEIRRAFGGQATDSERETMDRLIQPDEWDKNPTLMINQLQSLVSTLHANSAAITQNRAQNLNQASNPAQIQIPGAKQSSQSSPQMVTVISPAGNRVNIPANNLAAALKRGARQV